MGKRKEGSRKTMDRRSFLKGAVGVGAGVAGLALFPRFSSAYKETKELVICSWGGTGLEVEKKTLYEPFLKETGIRIKETSPPSMSKLVAMVQSGNVEYDLVHIDMGMYGTTARKGDFFEPIDYNMIDKKILANIDPKLQAKQSVGFMYWSLQMGYRTDAFPKGAHPKNWAEFWDTKKYPGGRCLQAMSPSTFADLEVALMADGVPPNKLYPIDVERAFKSLSKIKKNVVKWWDVGAVPGQLLVDKEVIAASCWNGRFYFLKRKKAPIDVEWNQALITTDNWIIPKGAPNYLNAMKFINLSLRPEIQGRYCEDGGYGPVNKDAFKHMSEDAKQDMPSLPKNLEKQTPYDMLWWADNADMVSKKWNEWILS
jgi:putative spermidine/putrescine transport system substrate-binding protein